MASDPPILQLVSLGDSSDRRLATLAPVLRCFDLPSIPADLPGLDQARVAVTSVRRGFRSTDFQLVPALEAICSWGVGYDTLDVATAIRCGIGISTTPDVLDDCVADLALALLLAAARRIGAADRYVRNGQWRTIGAFPLSTKVSGKRLGILGLGRIGSAIARRSAGFDMTVRYHARRPALSATYGYEPSLLALAEWCDFLVLACPGGPATRHLVDAAVLKAIGPKGILVNIARGSVVDERALEMALSTGELGGAGLDVLEHEPAVPPAFSAMDNVTMTPHIGSATEETRSEMARLVVDNVAHFLETGKLLTGIAETST